jgi:soluble lytic murein transglycosylase-like protein
MKYAYLVALGLSIAIVVNVTSFVHTHQFSYQSPVTFNQFVSVQEKKAPVLAVQIVEAAPVEPDPLNPIERYACNTFGKDCKIALAIMQAESHEDPNAINKNTNGTYDIGIMQINSVHFAQCSLSQLSDPKGNIDCAYKIYQRQGFSPWSSYTSGAYKKFIH